MTQDEIPSERGRNGNDAVVRFGVSMPGELVKQLDAWRERLGYANRSEAVRDIVRDKLVEQIWETDDPDAEAVGIVHLVYDHASRMLSDHLIEVQHQHHTVAQACLHIHLTPHTCLEVIVLRGRRADVTEMANSLLSSRGVLHGSFVPSTTGEGIP